VSAHGRGDPTVSSGPISIGPDVETADPAYQLRFRGAVGAYFLERQEQAVRALLPSAELLGGARVLDHAGGHCQLEPMLLSAGCDVTVSGSAPSCGARVSGSTRFICAPLDAVPEPDGAFDHVISIRLLAHAEVPRSIVAELCRLARQSVIVDYPSRRSVNVLAEIGFAHKRKLEKDTRRFRVFTDGEIDRHFASCGFERTGEVRQFMLPMAAHRAAGSNGSLRAFERLAEKVGLTGLFGSPVIARFEPAGKRGKPAA